VRLVEGSPSPSEKKKPPVNAQLRVVDLGGGSRISKTATIFCKSSLSLFISLRCSRHSALPRPIRAEAASLIVLIGARKGQRLSRMRVSGTRSSSSSAFFVKTRRRSSSTSRPDDGGRVEAQVYRDELVAVFGVEGDGGHEGRAALAEV
jgi:hypothetical protein